MRPELYIYETKELKYGTIFTLAAQELVKLLIAPSTYIAMELHTRFTERFIATIFRFARGPSS